jgi:hypothetical protein
VCLIFPRGYESRRGIISFDPWRYGNSFISPLRQESFKLKLEKFRILINIDFDRFICEQMNFARKYEQRVDEEKKVRIEGRRVFIYKSNGYRTYDNPIDVELVKNEVLFLYTFVGFFLHLFIYLCSFSLL